MYETDAELAQLQALIDESMASASPLLRAIAVHRVADRPDRFEPRMTKKGPRGYESLKRPRREIKLQMLKRASKI